MAKRFVVSALPYVNSQPHLGNIVGSVLGSDVYSRYCRKSGDEVVFVCGTDEYGTATEMEAMKLKVHPRDIVSKNRVLHKAVYDWMGIEFDFWGQTSCEEHTKMVQATFLECYRNKYFEEQEMEQFYCSTCSQFLADRFVEGECMLCGYTDARGDQCDKCGRCLKASDLRLPRCSLCLDTPVMKSSNHLFFRLDLLQDKIKDVMEGRKSEWTENARNIYNEWLNKKLAPRCMTRSLRFKWGVQVPLDGFEDKVFYVWFDAVLGYLTFLGQAKQDWREWIKDAKITQFMGKDNVFFHAFIFPGILLASGNVESVADVINSTEYLTFNGEKFSKSRKIGIFGMDLVEKDLGSPCLWRYYLIKRRPEIRDSDFSVEEFIDLTNADLRFNLGNLCQRVLKYLNKNCGGKVSVCDVDEIDRSFVFEMNSMYAQYRKLMDGISLRGGIEKAVEMSSLANKYIQSLQNNKEHLKRGFNIGYSAIVFLSHLFEPFIPETSKRIFRMCKVDHSPSSLFPEKFEVISMAEISDDIQILFDPLSKSQLSNLREYVKH